VSGALLDDIHRDPAIKHDLAAAIKRVPALERTPFATRVAKLGGDACKSQLVFDVPELGFEMA
jgi:hypothetical protein